MKMHTCNSGSLFAFQKVLETGARPGGGEHGLSGDIQLEDELEVLAVRGWAIFNFPR